ncbi:YjdF family protein [Candidatus Stoquefichus sp. SB1]|uniref:YjdF family protein n=1 Tax=Candidatus Stoquefichus sp. SB1 TaxID=1658109 RepID=UPI00067EAF54|nr:YjdF family protein [Candidatus Stoquefichus sp. SB1]
MDKISLQLTVYFENPFWMGMFELVDQSQLQVSRIIFGKEPMNEDILQAIYNQFCQLKLSPAVEVKNKPKHISYKRLQRDVKKQLQQQGVGTKSQIALKMQYEVSKQEHLVERKKRLEKEKQMKFVLKQQKKKEKHRGH